MDFNNINALDIIILISIFEYQNLIALPISLIIANLFTYIYSYIKLNKILFLKNHLIN